MRPETKKQFDAPLPNRDIDPIYGIWKLFEKPKLKKNTMKLILNNKIFTGRYNDKGKLIIPINLHDDRLFFKEWQNKTTRKNGEMTDKKDYIQDVYFVKNDKRGVLKSCFPILDINEDFVELVYDYYTEVDEIYEKDLISLDSVAKSVNPKIVQARRIKELQTQIDKLKIEIDKITKDRDEWKNCAEKTLGATCETLDVNYNQRMFMLQESKIKELVSRTDNIMKQHLERIIIDRANQNETDKRITQLEAAIDHITKITQKTEIKIGDNLDGGIVVYVDESGKHGIIAAVANFGYKNWNKANILCKGYLGGGFDDWRLPTKNELNLLYLARKIGIGGFVASIYWSSSEYSAAYAWCQNFNNGSQLYFDKSYNAYVRAVRSF